ncbi:MAG: hypothetical protein WC653_05370 [Candidatus Gracilibacteria bacterium]
MGEIKELLENNIKLQENNIKLQTIVNVYEFSYGPLTGKDAEEYLGKKSKNSLGKINGQIGPI